MPCKEDMPMTGWDPLGNPLHGLDVVSAWKALLHGEKGNYSMSSYAQLVCEVVVPAVRFAGVNTWHAKDPEPMLRFLECWEKLLPHSVLHIILDMVLKDAVDLWEPRRDTVPIHVWLHPWLPLLGHKLEDLYPTIRFKLSNVHPGDGSAFTVLSPWKKVFDSASWEQLMHRCIVPKLQLVLQDFQVNPAIERREQFNWVMIWTNAIPIRLMVDMMVKFFFPNWYKALQEWLLSNPNFQEVANWFMVWKELIPDELRVKESIRLHLHFGLEMMNQAVEGKEVVLPILKENTSYVKMVERRGFEAQQQVAAPPAAKANLGGATDKDDVGDHKMSLKEVIEAYAQEHGLLFKPKPERMHIGHQLYRFGKVSVIVDSLNQKVYAQTKDTWSCVSLGGLLDMHKTRREAFEELMGSDGM